MRWDHNIAYHGTLLSALPHGAERALDVGCGDGTFARMVAGRVRQVDAIDKSPQMIATAAQLGRPANVNFEVADFLTADLPENSYDYISMLAVAHHMPFADAIDRARRLLRPAGVLAVLGLYRRQTPVDIAATLAAAPVNQAFLAWHGRSAYPAPIANPQLGLREIRSTARRLLPGCEVRRLLLWRYLLLWRRPA